MDNNSPEKPRLLVTPDVLRKTAAGIPVVITAMERLAAINKSPKLEEQKTEDILDQILSSQANLTLTYLSALRHGRDLIHSDDVKLDRSAHAYIDPLVLVTVACGIFLKAAYDSLPDSYFESKRKPGNNIPLEKIKENILVNNLTIFRDLLTAPRHQLNKKPGLPSMVFRALEIEEPSVKRPSAA